MTDVGVNRRTPLLEVDQIERQFGGLRAVDGVTFQCERGERLALIGPNGAGKTTLINMITGYVAPDSGSVRIQGRDVTNLPAWKRSRAGLCRSFQTARVFDGLTVEENLVIADVACNRSIGGLGYRGSVRLQGTARRLGERADLVELLQTRAGELSYGDRRRLEMAMVSARNPDVLLLDEPAAGIEIGGRNQMMEFIVGLAEELGSALVFTEHDMDVVFKFATRVLVLVSGALIFDGPAHEAAADSRVQEAYLDDG